MKVENLHNDRKYIIIIRTHKNYPCQEEVNFSIGASDSLLSIVKVYDFKSYNNGTCVKCA